MVGPFLTSIKGRNSVETKCKKMMLYNPNVDNVYTKFGRGGRTGLVVKASDSGSGDPGSILGRVGVLFP